MNPQDIDALVSRMVDEGKSDEEIRAAVKKASAAKMTPEDRVRQINERIGFTPEKVTNSIAMALPGAAATHALGVLRGINTTSRIGTLAKNAIATLIGGSQNTKQGFREGVKRLGTNISSNAAMGAASAKVAGQDPVQGAKFGALVGVLPSVPEAARGTKNAVMNRIAPTAGQRLQRASANDVDDLLTRARARATTDPDALLSDVTEEHGTDLLEDAIRRGGREGSITRAQLGERAAKAVDPRAVSRSVGDAAGINTNQGVLGAQAEVDAAKRPAITELFGESVDQASDFYDDPRLRAILEQDDPDMQKAAKRAFDFVRTNRAANNRSVERTSEGSPVLRGADFYDQLRKQLGKIREAYKAAGDIGAADAVAMRQQEVEDILQQGLGPKYEQGIGKAAENFRTQEAFERGVALMRGGDDAIKDADLIFSRELELKNPIDPTTNVEIQAAMRQGAAHELVNQLERAKTPEALLDILVSSPHQERGLEFAIPDPHARESLVRDLNARLEKLYRSNRLAGAAPIAQLERPDAFGKLTPWSIASAMRGSPALAVAQGAGTWLNQIEDRIRKGSTEELAKLARERLTGPGGSLNPRIAQALTDRGRRQTITNTPAMNAALLRAGLTNLRREDRP